MPLYRRMVARDVEEQHRTATPLELFFDLCFVVAVSQAAGRLHHAVAADEVGHAVVAYLMVFFAIWWAWMNFTWFASAYDTDDVIYRITTMVLITGALVLAAGVPRAFDRQDFTVVTIGYVIMRLAMVTHWLRAAVSDPPHRRTAILFAAGIGLVQFGWVARLGAPHSYVLFALLVLAELAVPVIAERAAHTTWHPEHIAERFGLFTLIVLGESVLAATVAVQAGFDAGGHLAHLTALAAASLVTVFGMWWVYFDRPGHEVIAAQGTGFIWGYGHYLIFAAAAAVGAGIAVNVDVVAAHPEISARGGAWAFAVPVAVYLACVWLLHRRPGTVDRRTVAFPVAAVAVLLAPLLPGPLTVIAVVMVALVAITG